MPVSILNHENRVMPPAQFLRMTPKAEGTGLKNWIRRKADMDRGPRLQNVDDALLRFHIECQGAVTHLESLSNAAKELREAIDTYVKGKPNARADYRAIRVSVAQLLLRQVVALENSLRRLELLGPPDRYVTYLDSREAVREWQSSYYSGLGAGERHYQGNPYRNPDRSLRPQMSNAEVEVLRAEVEAFRKRDALEIIAEMNRERLRRIR